jgi:hypothetical protein
MMRKLAIGVILCLALFVPTAFAGTETLGYVYDLDSSLPDYVNAAWLGYLMQRQIYIREHKDQYTFTPGVIIPTFAEEVEGRKTLAQIWKELKQADPSRSNKYLNELIPVHEADFMQEYVWRYLKQPTWSKEPENLRLKEFSAWQRKHLTGHQAETRAQLGLKKQPPETPSPKQ